MTRCLIAVALLFSVSPLAAGPLVKARVSHDDVREIRRTVRSVTLEPVREISSDTSTHYVRGSVMEYWHTSSSRGNRRVKRYVRSDRVLVTAGRTENLTGPTFVVQKVRGKWTILGRGDWIR
jgi:hypothetical protein